MVIIRSLRPNSLRPCVVLQFNDSRLFIFADIQPTQETSHQKISLLFLCLKMQAHRCNFQILFRQFKLHNVIVFSIITLTPNLTTQVIRLIKALLHQKERDDYNIGYFLTALTYKINSKSFSSLWQINVPIINLLPKLIKCQPERIAQPRIKFNYFYLFPWLDIISQNKMLNYKNSMNSSYKYHEDMPTATKSYYADQSPSRLALSTPKSASIHKYGQRFHEAKSDIDYMINQMSQKRDTNQDALARVRNLNADALAYVGDAYSTPKAKHSRNQIRQDNFQPADFGDYSAVAQPGVNGYQNQGKGYGAGMMPTSTSLQGLTLQEQNIQLRKALNQQIRQNNDLLRRINHLEAQNDHLYDRLGIQSPRKNQRSTQYIKNPSMTLPNSHYASGVTNNQGFNPNPNPMPMPMPQTNYNQNAFYPANDNDDFRADNNMNSDHTRTAKFGFPGASSWNNSGNATSPRARHNRLPSQLMRELQEIKDYDEELRQKTLKLLKNQH